MKAPVHVPEWKASPFVRLLLPFVAGIMLQWYLRFQLSFLIISIFSFSIAFVSIPFLPFHIKYIFRKYQGLLLNLMITGVAMLLTLLQSARDKPGWYGNYIRNNSQLIIRVDEPPLEKPNSYKAEAKVLFVQNGDSTIPVNGRIILYFAKTAYPSLAYGNRLWVNASIQAIKNSGNPGAFNYERYAAFQGLYHTAYLRAGDYKVLEGEDKNRFYAFIYQSRMAVLNTLKTYISGNKNVEGIAEALLIGYKEDLDKDLVQAYSNTGVVHIIAISGLHLGLIYAVLFWIFTRVPWVKRQKIFNLVIILSFLWLFSFVTGASASVIRSAVMFTCILTGKTFFKQASTYNSLSASAFLMLSYNPYYLWDVGFQLSYLAVFGIVWLQQPIYRLFYISFWPFRQIWSLMSVTLAAQVFAFPVCLYYFHQFPNTFLFTNLFAVPLSTLILFGEIALLAFSWWAGLAKLLGVVISWLIDVMNKVIQTFNDLPYSLLDQVYANVFTTWLLYSFILGCCAWLLYKNKKWLYLGLTAFAGFVMVQSMAHYTLLHQQKIIVYNASKYAAVDIIENNNYYFIGDSILLQDALPRNFYLKPARVSLQVKPAEKLTHLQTLAPHILKFKEKSIFIINTPIDSALPVNTTKADILIISKNAKVDIKHLNLLYRPTIVVFDASNSMWKIEQWKTLCESLNLRCHSVPEQGAFVQDL